MPSNGRKVQEIILSKLDSIEEEIKQVRYNDIPNIKTDIAVVKVKSNNYAKIISSVIGAITLLVSTVIAWFRP